MREFILEWGTMPPVSTIPAILDAAFCPNCGSPLGVRSRYGHRSVLIGNLDHPEEWPPNDCHAGIESQIPWNVIHDDLPRCRTEDDPDFLIISAEEG